MEHKKLYEIAFHEDIVMTNSELPINFIEHKHNKTGPFCILHWHNEIELVYVKKGEITLTKGNKTVDAKSGELFFVNGNEIHGYNIKTAPIVLYCCTVSPTLLQGRYVNSYDQKFLPTNSQIAIFENHIIEDSDIIDYFLKMWHCGKSQKQGFEYHIKANLFGIMALMVERHIDKTISNNQFQSNKRNYNNINTVLSYIEEHYAEDITLEELAELLNVSKYYFCRFFKEITSSTAVEYINTYRIHQAIYLMMKNSDLTITQVATKVGFNDSNYFARVFRNITGASPKSYKTSNITSSKKYYLH